MSALVRRISFLALNDPRNSESRPAQRALRDSLSATGTVMFTDHPVDTELVKHVFEIGRRYFDLSIEVKDRHRRPKIGHQRGYTPFGLEHAKGQPDKPDLKEYWHQGRIISADHQYADHYGLNVDVPEVPGFTNALNKLHAAYDFVSSTQVLPVLSVLLGKPDWWLPGELIGGNDVLRLIHYLAQVLFAGHEGSLRSSDHEDIDIGTLIHMRRGRGLVLILPNGEIVRIETEGDELLCQIGDAFQALSAYAYPSVTHRVENPADPTESGMSVPYFIHSTPYWMIGPLPAFMHRPEAASIIPMPEHEFLRQRLIANGVLSPDV